MGIWFNMMNIVRFYYEKKKNFRSYLLVIFVMTPILHEVNYSVIERQIVSKS